MKNTVKLICGLAACAASGFAFAETAVPTVTDMSVTQGPDSRMVTVKYKLDIYPSVVTLDVMTNDTVSIGGEHICTAQGAVWRKVTEDDKDASDWCTITWHPEISWTGENGNGFRVPNVKFVVTAWPLDNTPDYMVVDISAGAQKNSQRYYPAVDFLPGPEIGQKGAVTNNVEYKTSKIAMRKIMAKDVAWTSGSTKMEASNDYTHEALLTNNFYMGVFELTQGQWAAIKGSASLAYFTNAAHRAERPMEGVSFNEIRINSDQWTQGGYEWPNAPKSNSFLGQLRNKTGLDFDLPSQAQWEFACRAGHGSGYWGDGSPLLDSDADANLAKLGRYKSNGGYIDGTTAPDKAATVENGTAIVGSYAPNSWGLYDMHGNVGEIVLDGLADLSTLTSYRGMVFVPANPTADTTYRRVMGGNYKQAAAQCRPGLLAYTTTGVNQNAIKNTSRGYSQFGLRLACQAGLK